VCVCVCVSLRLWYLPDNLGHVEHRLRDGELVDRARPLVLREGDLELGELDPRVRVRGLPLDELLVDLPHAVDVAELRV
jgi:hypothetical protein